MEFSEIGCAKVLPGTAESLEVVTLSLGMSPARTDFIVLFNPDPQKVFEAACIHEMALIYSFITEEPKGGAIGFAESWKEMVGELSLSQGCRVARPEWMVGMSGEQVMAVVQDQLKKHLKQAKEDSEFKVHESQIATFDGRIIITLTDAQIDRLYWRDGTQADPREDHLGE